MLEFAGLPLHAESARVMKLTLVIPVYNEAAAIASLIDRVRLVPVEKEMVIVDDCSSDGTRQVLEGLAPAVDLRLLYHDVNRGKGAALRTGFKAATGDVVVVQDADLEYDPMDLPKLMAPIADGRADVVYGSRFAGGERAIASCTSGTRSATRCSPSCRTCSPIST